jgi:hypothetical protein
MLICQPPRQKLNVNQESHIMSLESKVEELTTAVTGLTALLREMYAAGQGAPTAAPAAAPAKPAKPTKPKPEAVEPAPKDAEPEAPAETAAPAITLADLQKQLIEVIRTVPEGRSKVDELLAPYGVKKTADLKPSNYAAVSAAAAKLSAATAV